jgi:hypothetical protein
MNNDAYGKQQRQQQKDPPLSCNLSFFSARMLTKTAAIAHRNSENNRKHDSTAPQRFFFFCLGGVVRAEG